MDGNTLAWIQTLDWPDYLGIGGVVVYIGSYFALQAGLIRGRGYLFPGLNALAGMLVLLSLVDNFNLPSALINSCYIAISAFGIARFYLLRRRAAFDPEDLDLVNALVPGLPPVDARRLLDLGRWHSAGPGYCLTAEGEIPDQVHFVLSGGAYVDVAGVTVADLGPKSLVGEMSCLTGLPASATVTLSAPSRLFSVEIAALNRLLGRNVEIRHELQSKFATHVSAKLVSANAALSARPEVSRAPSS